MRLFRRKTSNERHARTMPVTGEGFTQEVIGDDLFQDALASAAGGWALESHDLVVPTALVPEPTNPVDPTVVRVDLIGAPGTLARQTGYLPPDDAERIGKPLRMLLDEGIVVECPGRIVGGWNRGPDDTGPFAIWLSVPDADRLMELATDPAKRPADDST
jgi:hypothetical protein